MKTMILCAPGLEECEALVVYDLLYRAGIAVELVGLEKNITSSHKVTFETDRILKDADLSGYECLILPGGMPGTKNLENDPLVQDAVTHFVKEEKLIAALCAAPSILIHRGLLNDREFTCFPGHESGKVSLGVKAHRHGNIITGKGLGAAMEFSELIIRALKDEETADSVLRKVQYR